MQTSDIIVLGGATSTQGIAKGAGDTFYAGDLYRGHIYQGDFKSGTAEILIHAPVGRKAMGLWADLEHGWLFVGGGLGWAYVYDLATGETVAEYQFGVVDDLKSTLVNKAFVNHSGAWFSDTSACVLYHVPISASGELGTPRTLKVTGEAAEISGHFNLNGIVAPEAGTPLIVSHTAQGRIYTVEPGTGASRRIEGLELRSADGLLLEGRQLWVVQNWANQVSRVRLSDDLTSGTVEGVITDDAFQFPTTAVAVGPDRLAVVNAKADTGIVPTAEQFEVVVVDR